jgi:subtilisin family serine protease
MVDIAAPGVGIMSTMINVDGPGYASWSGTSMSTAFVAGAVALLVDQSGQQALTFAQALDRLVANGEVLDDENPAYAGMLGRGLNVSGALGVAAPISSIVHLPGLLR